MVDDVCYIINASIETNWNDSFGYCSHAENFPSNTVSQLAVFNNFIHLSTFVETVAQYYDPAIQYWIGLQSMVDNQMYWMQSENQCLGPIDTLPHTINCKAEEDCGLLTMNKTVLTCAKCSEHLAGFVCMHSKLLLKSVCK